MDILNLDLIFMLFLLLKRMGAHTSQYAYMHAAHTNKLYHKLIEIYSICLLNMFRFKLG